MRFAVRENEQVALLKTICEKQNAQIDLLIAAIHKDDK
ncbi:YebO family protein [Serratia sp. D1N4]